VNFDEEIPKNTQKNRKTLKIKTNSMFIFFSPDFRSLL